MKKLSNDQFSFSLFFTQRLGLPDRDRFSLQKFEHGSRIRYPVHETPGLRGALGDDLDEGKALVGDGLCNGFRERNGMGCSPAGDIGRTRCLCKLTGVKRVFRVSEKGGFGFCARGVVGAT